MQRNVIWVGIMARFSSASLGVLCDKEWKAVVDILPGTKRGEE